MNKKVITLGAVLAAYACTIHGATPQLDSPKLVKFQQKAAQTTATMVKAHESTKVNHESSISVNLAQSINLAIANNRDLRQSQWDYEAAAAQVSATAAGKNPSLAYAYNAARTGSDVLNNGSRLSTTGNNFSHRLSVDMPLYNRALDAAVDAARYNREGVGAAMNTTAQNTKLIATQNYLSLIMLRNKVEIAEQTVRDYEEHLKNVNLQYEVGIVAKSDVLATTTRLANAKTALVTAKNRADVGEATFNNHVGLPTKTKVTTAEKELGYVPYMISLEDAQQYALYHRSEIVTTSMAVKSAEENVTRASAGDLPSIGASASRTFNGNEWDGNDNKGWTVGAALSWNLWDGGQSKENVKVAKANLERAKEANAQMMERVELQVHEAYLSMKSAEQTILSTRTAVEEGQENFRIASLRYRAGVGTNVDVLDAETALATARDNYVDALYNYNINVATLEQAMGVPVNTPIGGGSLVVEQSK